MIGGYFPPGSGGGAGGVPVGTIIDFGGGVVPTGALACDGATVSRTTYSALFSAIGTTWGAGDGSTTFGLPDLRGRASIGSGTGSGLTARTLGQSVGAEAHLHASGGTHDHNVESGGQPVKLGTYSPGGNNRILFDGTDGGGTTTGLTTSANSAGNTSGSGTQDSTIQPSAVVTKAIVYSALTSPAGSDTPWTVDHDGAGFAFYGAIAAQLALVADGTLSYTTLGLGTVTNAGAAAEVIATLPAATAGRRIRARVVAAFAFRIKAAGTDVIRNESTGSTAAGGYLRSSRVGSTLELECHVAGTWDAVASGTWAKDSTTSAGFAFTPTAWAAFTSVAHSWDADADVSESGLWRQVGSHVEAQVKISFAGAPPNTNLTLDMAASSPSFAFDESASLGVDGAGASDTALLGPGQYYDSSAALYNHALSVYWNETANTLTPCSGGLTTNIAGVSQASPITWAAGDSIALRFSFPVA